MNNRFIIISPLYNSEEWIKKCIDSVKDQEYSNYIHYIVDDLSTDSSYEIAQSEAENSKKIKVIKNIEKKYALGNVLCVLDSISPEDEDVIITLDGDDWLSLPSVLERLNNIYVSKECWMTYGSYMEFPNNLRGVFSRRIPSDIVENNLYREHQWMSSHLRTSKYKLWKNIDRADLIYSKTGELYRAATDLATVFPMLEMSKHRAKFIPDILHIYNRKNPLNEDKVDHSSQLSEEAEIRSRAKYDYIEGL
jgi:glycosyltransferase involved in cell wall biosynthesis